MSEGRLLVGDSAVIALKELLADTGVLKRTEDQLRERLFEVVNNLWAGGKATKLGGGAWIIDIGKWFGDLALYARVVPLGDSMVVSTILDESEVIDAKVQTALDSSRGGNPTDEQPTATNKASWKPAPPQPMGRRRIEQALVRWQEPKVEEGGDPWAQDRVDVGKIPEKVQELVARGVSVHDIEIWTNMKRPKINVELV